MKNVNNVLDLLNKAVQANSETTTWFFSFSGHVQLIDVRLYPQGWGSFDDLDKLGQKPEYFVKSAYLDREEQVTELYYWIKFKLDESKIEEEI